MKSIAFARPSFSIFALSLALGACGTAAAPAAVDPATAAVAPATAAVAPAAALTATVFTSSEKTFNVTSTLIAGSREAVLVDGQFSLSEARRLADQITASGKKLTAVFITHAHPDHWFGLEVIKERFPDARLLASPAVVAEMRTLAQPKVAQWKPMLGDDVTSSPVFPESFAGDHLDLEGQRIDLVTLEPGEIESSVVLHVPSIKTVVTGDMAYNGVHVWLAETNSARRKGWLRNIDKVRALGATVVVAGHKVPDRADTPAVLDDTAKYIQDFEKAVTDSKDAASLQQKMLAIHGDRKLPVILQIASQAAFSDKH